MCFITTKETALAPFNLAHSVDYCVRRRHEEVLDVPRFIDNSAVLRVSSFHCLPKSNSRLQASGRNVLLKLMYCLKFSLKLFDTFLRPMTHYIQKPVPKTGTKKPVPVSSTE